MRIPLLLLTLFLVGLLACAGGRRLGEPSAAEQTAYATALETLAADPQAGRRALRSFVLTWPQSALADDAAFRLARLALERGDHSEAARRLRWVIRVHPLGDQAGAARLLLASLQRKAGQLDAAWNTLSGVRLPLLSHSERRHAHSLLADLAMERGDAAASLHWLARVLSDADSQAAAQDAETKIDAVLEKASLADLERAAQALGRRVPAARVQLRLGELHLEAGDREAAELALRRAEALPLTPAEADRLVRLEAHLARGEEGIDQDGILALPTPSSEVFPDPARARGTVGVVLPLSGRLSSFGERSLRGALLAARLFDGNGSDPEGSVRVVVRDTGGTADGAAAAVYELAGDASVAAIVGPLLLEESRGAAEAAEAAGLPLLSLSRREEVAAEHPHVLRLGTRARVEVEVLADHALRAVDARRVAILYPKDSYGRAMRAAFWDAVEARGAQVVGIAGYEPDATDFAEPIRLLVGYALLSPGEKEVIKERDRMRRRAKRLPPEEAKKLREEAADLTFPNGRPLPPLVDFDVLFIPDSHEKVALIAPQLAFHDVRGIQLLGPSGWSHPDLVTIGRKHVEGAVFAAPYHPVANTPFAADFTRRYRETFDGEPERFAAEFFDATNLVLMELASGARSREEVRTGLLDVRGYPGASGVISVLPDGNARKRPALFRVQRGKIVPID